MSLEKTKEEKWDLYIIQTLSGKLYTGITTDLEKRFQAHLNTKKGARFFRISAPEKIVYSESFPNRSLATKREIYIKKLNRKAKFALIEGAHAS